MTTTTPSRSTSIRYFVRHFLEMVAAMVAGMAVLEPLWMLIFPLLGWSGVLERPDLHALIMATEMTITM